MRRLANFSYARSLSVFAPTSVFRPTFHAMSQRAQQLSTGSEQYDATQLAMMEEMCIVVDEADTVVGSGTKKEVHLIDGMCMKEEGLPHRAFSVFLFNERHELLLQKRCDQKILFPLHWANTCCSHPLAEDALFMGTPIKGEANGADGCIQAAQRKLQHELGLTPLPKDAFTFVTKVHYKAPLPGSNPRWGEHEMDYILLAQAPQDLIEQSLSLNPGEVEQILWVDQEACRAFVDAAGDPMRPDERPGEWLSPWFAAIERTLLHPWWDKLRKGETVPGDGKIHRLDGV